MVRKPIHVVKVINKNVPTPMNEQKEDAKDNEKHESTSNTQRVDAMSSIATNGMLVVGVSIHLLYFGPSLRVLPLSSTRNKHCIHDLEHSQFSIYENGINIFSDIIK